MKSKTDLIIADFLSPSMKERVLYELSSPKKRIKAFERFSHNVESVIRPEYLYYKGEVISEKIKSELKRSVTECIVLSFEYQQGNKMLTENALDYLIYESTFVIILTENWLIIKPEHECGKGLYYILRKNQ